jgi:hypothetical protein
MQEPQEFADHLAALDADELGLEDGHSTIADSLRRLGVLAARAVPSCRALSVTVSPLGRPCTVLLEHPQGAAPIVSSLRLSIPAGKDQAAELILYAVAAAAFDVLAGLLRDGFAQTAPVLDQDLALPAEATAGLAAQLDDLSAVGRATGILLDRGLPFDEARVALEASAEQLGVAVPTAARLLVTEASGGDRNGVPDGALDGEA